MSDGDVAVGCKWCKLTVAVLGRADLPRGSPRYSLKWPILSCVGGVLLFAALLVRKSMSHCRAVRSMQAMCGNKTGGGGGSCVKREHGKVKTGQTGQTSQRARSTDRLIPASNNPINRVCSCHRSPSTAKAVCLGCSPRIIQQAARTIHAVEVEMGKKMVWNPDPVLDFGTRPAKPRGSVESSKAKRYSRAAKSAKSAIGAGCCRKLTQAVSVSPGFDAWDFPASDLGSGTSDPDLHSARLDICRACDSLSVSNMGEENPGLDGTIHPTMNHTLQPELTYSCQD